MYDAYHHIVAVAEPAAGSPRPEYDVVGPVCETSDLFAAGRALPELKNGDLVAILSAGAYGAVMASDYNARPAPCEVLVSGEQWGIVHPRETYADLIAKDRIPDWLAD
jgi:diaminopimelate decarboxylase